MPNISCDRSIRCPGTDSPVSNFSSEAVDGVDYFGRKWPIWAKPGGPLSPDPAFFSADSCLGIQTAPTQELADLLAALAAQICALGDDPDGTTDDGPPSVPPIDPPDSPISPVEPGTPTTTTTVLPTIYYNTAQNCLWVCPDGTTLSHVVDAGYFADTTQALADQRAYQYACQQVARNRMCFSSLNSAACLGQEYDEVLVVSKGIGVITPVTFTVIAGAIPDGIVMTSSLPAFLGLSFFGTPTTAGNYSFTIQAVPVFGATITKTFTINVLGITNCPLPDGTVGADYSEVLQAAGGTAPYTFSADPVTIPDWMTIDPDGTVHGNPDEELLFEFEVTVTDSNGQSCTQTCSVDVVSACPDWSGALVWPVAGGGTTGAGTRSFTPSGVTAGDHFVASVSAPTIPPDGASAFNFGGGNWGTLYGYSGPACNCNLHLIFSKVGAITGQVLVNSGGPYFLAFDFATNPSGTYDIPFTVPDSGGIPYDIIVQITLQAVGGAGPKSLSVDGTFSNV